MKEQASRERISSARIRPAEIVIILLITLAAAGMFLHKDHQGGTAVIKKDGTLIKELSLSADTVWKMTDGSMEFTVADGRICVSSADCHDKVCMHTGYISGGFQSIVCLPNRVTVTIESTDDDPDIDVIL